MGRVGFAGGGPDDEYASNTRVADLNAPNTAVAVIKCKKVRGLYRDDEREHHSTDTTATNRPAVGD